MTTMPRSRPHDETAPQRNTGLLVFSWLFVGLPLAWGIIQTVIKSMALFH